jgi:hypothetical protein
LDTKTTETIKFPGAELSTVPTSAAYIPSLDESTSPSLSLAMTAHHLVSARLGEYEREVEAIQKLVE